MHSANFSAARLEEILPKRWKVEQLSWRKRRRNQLKLDNNSKILVWKQKKNYKWCKALDPLVRVVWADKYINLKAPMVKAHLQELTNCLEVVWEELDKATNPKWWVLVEAKDINSNNNSWECQMKALVGCNT